MNSESCETVHPAPSFGAYGIGLVSRNPFALAVTNSASGSFDGLGEAGQGKLRRGEQLFDLCHHAVELPVQ
jgi:hypothetical protein